MMLEEVRKQGCIEGSAGYIFAMHEVETLDIITGQREYQDVPRDNFRENLESRQKLTARSGIRWAHVIVPDKTSVCAQQFPVPTRSIGADLAEAGLFCSRLLFPLRSFAEAPGGRPAFNLVDSHPQHTANVLMLRQIAALCDISLPESQWLELESSYTLALDSGDLGCRFTPPRTDMCQIPTFDWPSLVIDNGLEPTMNGMTVIHINEAAPIRLRALFFGDSCIMNLARTASYVFKEILYCRSYFYHPEVVEGVMPDLVLTGESERKSWVPNDRERHLYVNMPGIAGISPPERRAFWHLFDALSMTSFEPHRFPEAVAMFKAGRLQ